MTKKRISKIENEKMGDVGGLRPQALGDNLPLYTYPVVAGYLQKEKLWRVFYSVSPRTPEGGQAGKGDKPPPYTYPVVAGYLGEEEGSDGKGNK